MSEDASPDPFEPWVYEISEAHNAKRHIDGVQCRGSVALIDDAARLRGVAEVKLGKAISLEREIETRPQKLAELTGVLETERDQWRRAGHPDLPDGHGYVELEVTLGAHGRFAAGGDVIKYDAHGVHHTHLDGLAHIGGEGIWHGPIPLEASQTDEDTMVNWAQHGIATRGVLLDITAARGVDWVTKEEPVTGGDLDRALAATGVTLQPGDALIIYQGRDRYEAAGNVYPSGAAAVGRPGIGQEGAKWIVSKDPGAIVWDFHDARNGPRALLEVHSLIWAIGLCLIDNALLGPAVATLRAAGTAAGLLVAAPPAIHRSTGVLINPLLLY